tara:strand:- start:271 stop:477 length:207 start_codon:yes stop_codon:yes gene_type:complete
MTFNYNTCAKIKIKIDDLLKRNSQLQANLGIESTNEEKEFVLKETETLMIEIKSLDSEFHKLVNPSHE